MPFEEAIGGKLLCKPRVSRGPKPPSGNSISLWLGCFLCEEKPRQSILEVFGEGTGEKPFFKKVLPRLLSSKGIGMNQAGGSFLESLEMVREAVLRWNTPLLTPL